MLAAKSLGDESLVLSPSSPFSRERPPRPCRLDTLPQESGPQLPMDLDGGGDDLARNSPCASPGRVTPAPAGMPSLTSCAVPPYGLAVVPVYQIQPCPIQPRVNFSVDLIEHLSSPMKAGRHQPLLEVEPAPGAPGRYQIVGAEQRWRAARAAGLTEVLVRLNPPLGYLERLEKQYEENRLRADLDPVQEAHCLTVTWNTGAGGRATRGSNVGPRSDEQGPFNSDSRAERVESIGGGRRSWGACGLCASQLRKERRRLGIASTDATPAAASWNQLGGRRLTAVTHQAVDPVPGRADLALAR
jgi:hypothetical protein